MRISDTDVWEFSAEAPGRQSTRYGAPSTVERVIIRLKDDNGNEGWGESVPLTHYSGETASTAAAALREATGNLIKRSLDDPLAEIDRLTDFSKQHAARVGLEVALLDLLGKTTGKSITHWLGGERRTEISLYRGIGLLSPREAIERAQKYHDRGVSTFKVKVGVDLEKDAERVLALRKAFGNKINIRMDANGGYSPEEALRFCEKLVDARIEHLEQPVRPEEDSIFQVCRRIRAMGVPVAVDESLLSDEDAKRFIDEDAVDAGVLKSIKFGGPVAARRVGSIFEKAGKSPIVSSPYESLIGKAATLALALSLEKGDRAHEFSDPEGDFAASRHRYEGGRFTWKEGAGLGAWGIPDRLHALAKLPV